MGREGELELSDVSGFEGELGAANAAGIDGQGFGGGVVDQREPGVRLQLEADVALDVGIVVDAYRN